jgi:hypothetical protein
LARFREFSSSEDLLPKERTVDSDAPPEFRNELVDLVFSLAEEHWGEEYFYHLMTQNIGASVSGKPYGGYRYAIGRDLGRAHWVRVYDLLPRLADEFRKAGGLLEKFRSGLNRILAGNAIAWDMDEEGRLVRVLPQEAATTVRVAMRELARPEFEAANKLLLSAIDAYNAQPQRPRDVCANAFDAIESTGKVVAQVPSGTFGDVLKQIRKDQALAPETLRLLEALNTMRHNHFGHGMSEPFSLSSQEVDFVYLSCMAAIILFARMRPHDAAT